MSHIIFHVGPLERHSGDVHAYFVHPGKPDREVFFDGGGGAALATIKKAYEGEPLACEPQLQAGAQQHQLPTRPLTPEEAHALGLVAFDLASPGAFEDVRPTSVYHFATASAFFFHAEPWRRSYGTQTLGVAFTGSLRKRVYARLLGAAGSAPGLALFPHADAVDRMLSVFGTGDMEAAAGIDVLGASLEEGPSFGVDAMTRAYGLPRFPVVTKLDSGRRLLPDDADLLALAATLRAVSALAGDVKEAHAEVSVDDVNVGALAFVQ